AFARSDYKSSIDFLRSKDPGAKFLSTQWWVQKLFVANENDVMPSPYGFRRLLTWHIQGYRYLIIDPQAYISSPERGRKFETTLKGATGFFNAKMEPIKVFPHFSPVMLERVVFE